MPILQNMLQDSRAGVTTIAALALPVIVGAAGLAFDLNRGYQQRIINQRAADMAALGAAMAYQNASSNTAVLTPTAQDIANANGLSGASVNASVVTDYPNAGDTSVRVQVDRPLPFALGSVLGFRGNFTVTATSFASLTTETNFSTPCYLALDGGADAIVTSGGTTMSAPLCAIAAVGSIQHDANLIDAADIISGSGDISVTDGSHITSSGTVRYSGNLTVTGGSTVPPSDQLVNQGTTLSDPWAGDVDLVGALSVITTFPSTTPSMILGPSVPEGTDVHFKAWEGSPIPGGTVSGNTITLPTGTYNFRNYQTNGGTKVAFGDGSTVTVSGTFSPGGGVNFGNSNVYIANDFTTGWGNTVAVGDGTLHIGGNATFNQFTKGAGNVTVAGTMTVNGTTSFGDGNLRASALTLGGGTKFLHGEGDVQINSGIAVGGGSTVQFGDGDIRLGKFSGGSYDGHSIHLSGSGEMFMGDGVFIADGDIHSLGGSAIIFGATPNHLVNGNLWIEGAAIFGEGRYTVNGWFKNGTGGASWPRTSLAGGQVGATIGGVSTSGYEMIGVDVTFITKDGYSLAGGADAWLEASTGTSTGGQIGDLLFASMSSNKVTWGAGSSSVMSGSVYFPNATVEFSGGNSTVSTSGGCMSAVAKKFEIKGGAFTGTACARMENVVSSGTGNASIRLVG